MSLFQQFFAMMFQKRKSFLGQFIKNTSAFVSFLNEAATNQFIDRRQIIFNPLTVQNAVVGKFG